MTSAPSSPTANASADAGWMLAVDFGTTSTVAAMTFADRSVEVLEVDGERRTPSVILVDEDGSLVVGNAAVGLAASRPERTIRAPKRRLGEQTPVVLGGKPFSPVDLVAAVLRHVRAEAVRHVGSEPSSCRLTHPATWSRPLQQRLLEAAAKAGMPDAELVPEPVAAAMAAADRQLPVGSHIAVYDLGGGTFDTNVVRRIENGYEVIGHPIGDRQIGGELFDEALMNHVGSRLDPGMWEKLQVSDERSWHQASSRLLAECRRVKESLSSHTYGEIIVGTPDGMIEERITRDELESIVAPYLDASIELVRRCVDDVGIEASELSAIHMIGGASRMPLAAEKVEHAFPGVEVSRRGDPRTAVALGASLVQISGAPDEIVGDRNTTLERRQFSIDTDSPGTSATAAAAASVAAGLAAAGETASPPAAAETVPAPAADPTVSAPATAAPTTAAPGTVAPGTVAEPVPTGQPAPHPIAAVAPQPAPAAQTTPPPASSFAPTPPPPGGPTNASPNNSLPMPALFGAGALVIALLVGAFVMLRPDGNGDTNVAGSKSQPTVSSATSAGGNSISTDTTTTTVVEPAETTTTTAQESTTAPAVGGPTATEASNLLLDIADLPGEGWSIEPPDDEPIYPCGIRPPFNPRFTEQRGFIKNRGTLEAVVMLHTVDVFATEAEAIAVIQAAEALDQQCSNTTVNVEGTDFDTVIITANLADPEFGGVPQSQLDFIPGDDYVLQSAYLVDPVTNTEIVDFVYVMRLGRSIISLEAAYPMQPNDDQLTEFTTLVLSSWAEADTFTR